MPAQEYYKRIYGLRRQQDCKMSGAEFLTGTSSVSNEKSA